MHRKKSQHQTRGLFPVPPSASRESKWSEIPVSFKGGGKQGSELTIVTSRKLLCDPCCGRGGDPWIVTSIPSSSLNRSSFSPSTSTSSALCRSDIVCYTAELVLQKLSPPSTGPCYQAALPPNVWHRGPGITVTIRIATGTLSQPIRHPRNSSLGVRYPTVFVEMSFPYSSHRPLKYSALLISLKLFLPSLKHAYKIKWPVKLILALLCCWNLRKTNKRQLGKCKGRPPDLS